MNSEPNNDFEKLRKLLSLKRYEAPPPRYFNDFSSHVLARLAQPAREEQSWLQRLGFDFDLRPALMCGVGIVVCGLLSFGVIGAMQIAEPKLPGLGANQLSSAPMGSPTFSGGLTPVMASAENVSIAPFISKQSASPFSQFPVTPAGFNTFGPLGN